jgi:2-phosphosulfolactate phosphatase
VIDVFRAFTVACYLSDQRAKEIISVGNIEIAYKLKEEHPEIILVGERAERMPVGFYYGNSPTHINVPGNQ